MHLRMVDGTRVQTFKRFFNAPLELIVEEPILRTHIGEVMLNARWKSGLMRCQPSIHRLAELLECLVVKLFPLRSQHMVVDHIDDNWGITPLGRSETLYPFFDHLMRICEGIDRSMKADSISNPSRIKFIGISFH